MSPQTPELSLSPTIAQMMETSKHLMHTIASSKSLSWQNIHLEHTNLKPTDEYINTAPSNVHQLVLATHGHTHLQAQLDQGSFYDVYTTPGMFHLLPVYHGVNSRWDLPCTISMTTLSGQMSAQFEDSAFKGDPDHIRLVMNMSFFDPLLRHLVMELCNEVQNARPLGNLFAESVAHLLMLHLIRNYSTAVIVSKSNRAVLSLLQRRTIETYIDDHLGETITLDAVAHAIHVSVPHFERMFRAAYHCPPYQYVLERRIERAKSLLKDSTLSIYEVARLTGFANQSHFTRHFTRRVNVSPAKFAELSKT